MDTIGTSPAQSSFTSGATNPDHLQRKRRRTSGVRNVKKLKPATTNTNSLINQYAGTTTRALRKRPSISQPTPAKKHQTKVIPQQIPPQKTQAADSAEIKWYLPTRTELGRIMIPEHCLTDDLTIRVNGDSLRDLVDKHHFSEMVYTDKSDIAGTGVFATRDYIKGEFIGFYKGRLVKHCKVSKKVLADYRRKAGIPAEKLAPTMYITWQDNDGQVEIIKLPDSHILWTYIYISGTNIELGIDGLQGGNALAYLNHSMDGNVIPISLCSRQAEVHNIKRLTVAPGQHNNETVMAAIVASRRIEANEELTFNYFPEAADVDFSKIGSDIFQLPELYYEISQDKVTLKKTFPHKKAFASKETATFDFEKTLTEDDKQLLAECKANQAKALKTLTDAVLQGNDHYLNIYLFFCLCHLKVSINFKSRKRGRSPMSWIFPNVNRIREHISTHFSPADGAKMLKLAEEPEKMQRSTLERPASNTELTELVRQIKTGGNNAKDALKEFLFCRFNRSNTNAASKQNILDKIVERLRPVRSLLGKPGNSWHQEHYYKFAIDEGVFFNDVVRIQFMPIRYLTMCFSSNNEKDKAVGLKALNEFCCLMYANKKSPCAIASVLGRNSVPNPFAPDFPACTKWKESDLNNFDSTRLLHGAVRSDPYKAHLNTWLATSSSRKQQQEALAVLKIYLANGNLTHSKLVYQMRHYGLSIKQIIKKLRKLRGLKFKEYTTDKVRSDIYRHMPEDCDFTKQIVMIGSAIEVAYARLELQPANTSLDSLNALFLENELTILQTELNTTKSVASDKKPWYKLLKKWPVPCLYKLHLAHMVKKRNPGDIATQFKIGRIPIITTLSPLKTIASNYWNSTYILKSLYNFKLFDLRNKNGLSIAPTMAAMLPSDYRFSDVYIDDKPFSDWIKTEINEHVYPNEVKLLLRQRGYLGDTK